MKKSKGKSFQAEDRIESSLISLPPDAVFDDTGAVKKSKKDQTEALTRARRKQQAQSSSAPAPSSQPARPARKSRAWLRFLGLGDR